MNCREFIEFLSDYLEGALPEEQRDVFERHMGDCPPCVTFLDTFRETIQLGKESCREDLPGPEEAPEELVRAILHARNR